MPRTNLQLNAPSDLVREPILWRIGKLFNVTTNIKCARISNERGIVSLDIDGSVAEIEQAQNYLRSLNMLDGLPSGAPSTSQTPDVTIPQPNTIHVRLSTVNSDQAATPILYRVAKDYRVVINVLFSAVDDEGGTMDISIAGALLEVQRAIAFLHTTGIRVSPRERSVSDNGNL